MILGHTKWRMTQNAPVRGIERSLPDVELWTHAWIQILVHAYHFWRRKIFSIIQ